MAGASPSGADDVLIVADSTFDRRYYYSAARAVDGAGYMGEQGSLKVYRLDEEAGQTLTLAIRAEVEAQERAGQWDGYKAKWSKQALEALRTAIQNCTGIRRT